MLPLTRDPIPRLAPRVPDSHKGTFGRALIVGGSRGMAGAPVLAGRAALRGGAGLVQVAVPAAILDVVAGFEASYLTTPLADDAEGRIARGAADRLRELAAPTQLPPLQRGGRGGEPNPQLPIHRSATTAWGIGPGLGQSAELGELVTELYRDVTLPAVFDADALNLLAKSPGVLAASAAGPRILTPHPGEFARLIGRQLEDPARREAADELALRSGAVVLLKGHRTYVTDGRQAAENTTGNPGMATGGAGDVLTGLLVALLCQGMGAWEAARAGAYLHGLAGDLAAADKGQVSLIASDLVDYLPAAFKAS